MDKGEGLDCNYFISAAYVRLLHPSTPEPSECVVGGEWHWVPRFVILDQSLIVFNRENSNVPTTMQGDSHLKV